MPSSRAQNRFSDNVSLLSSSMEHTIQRLLELYKDGRSLPGLASITRLLEQLGNPQDQIRCIHVAGTNGKGSTCAYMETILRASGYRTGLFPSPHLDSFTEYMRIDGQEIGEETLAFYASKVLEACDRITKQGFEHPTFFEVITACTYLCFADQHVDIAVVETAMGGRLDATNVIMPVLSVITQIGMDHVAVLGPGVDNIAREKAGIIKEGVPVVMARQQYSLPQMVIRSVCQEKHCQLLDVDAYESTIVSRALTGQRFQITIEDTSYTIDIPLMGNHQVDNAMTALCAVRTLVGKGYTIPHDAIVQGFKDTYWPGRMQIIEHDGVHVLLDGAHNPQAAEALKQAINAHLKNEKLILACGILNTKDAKGISEAFASFAHRVVCTKVDNIRAMEPKELLAYFEKLGLEGEVIDDVDAAVKRALTLAKAHRAQWIVATGSLYMLADVKRALKA